MANKNAPFGFVISQSMAGHVELAEGELAASQTIAEGDALTVASGYIEIATATSASIVGVAAQAVSGSSLGDKILYVPATPQNKFEAQVSGTYAKASNRWVDYDISGSTGAMEVNIASTTYAVFRIIGERTDPKNEIGNYTVVEGFFVKSAFTAGK